MREVHQVIGWYRSISYFFFAYAYEDFMYMYVMERIDLLVSDGILFILLFYVQTI